MFTPMDHAGRRRPRFNVGRALLGAALAATVTLAACGAPGASTNMPPEERGQENSRSIKIAVMAPLTGGAAAVGEPQLNFVRLAVEQFNRERNLTIELVEGDTELDPAKATTLAQRFAGDNDILAVVGPAASHEVAAVTPVFASAGLALVSPSATKPDLTTKGYNNLFRVVPRDDVQGATLSRLIIEDLGARSVYLIEDRGAYGVGLADEIEPRLSAAGVEVRRESISQDVSDFSALVTHMRGHSPDVVIFAGQLASQGAQLARQMREQDLGAVLVGGDGLMTSDLIAQGGDAVEGSLVTFFAPDITGLSAARPVVETYQQRFGEIGPFGPPAYAATMVALEAIERAYLNGNLTREAVQAEIAATNQAESLLGVPIAFDERGDIRNASFFAYRVKDGAFVPMQ